MSRPMSFAVTRRSTARTRPLCRVRLYEIKGADYAGAAAGPRAPGCGLAAGPCAHPANSLALHPLLELATDRRLGALRRCEVGIFHRQQRVDQPNQPSHS